MNKHLKGLYPALLTPFDQGFKVDSSSLKNLIDFNVAKGVDGFYVCGSSAEVFTLNFDERVHVMETVSTHVEKSCRLIAQVGGISTEECIKLARIARELGYDAISAVAPFYYPFTFDEILAHYRAIIEAAETLPMLVYNIPGMSGVKLTKPQLQKLLDLPNVIGLKQTSSDLYQMEQLCRAYPDYTILNGFDELLTYGLMAGADGGIGSTYNLMAERYVGIQNALREGDVSTAQALQADCNRVIDVLIEVGVFQGLKFMLHAIGVIQTANCRRPFSPLNARQVTVISKILSEFIDE